MSKQNKAAGTSAVTVESMEDQIRSLAYQLYCEGGYQNGCELAHWLQAEQQILTRGKGQLRRVA